MELITVRTGPMLIGPLYRLPIFLMFGSLSLLTRKRKRQMTKVTMRVFGC